MNLILIKTGVNMFAVIRNGVTAGTIRREKINRKHMWHATGINGSQGIIDPTGLVARHVATIRPKWEKGL